MASTAGADPSRLRRAAVPYSTTIMGVFKCLVCLCAVVAVTVSTDVGSDCQWYWGGYGANIHCPGNSVGMGGCGSGQRYDCNSGRDSVGLYCCYFADSRRAVDVVLEMIHELGEYFVCVQPYKVPKG